MTYANPQNMSGIIDIFTYANSVSDNMFGIGFVLSLYIIITIYMSGRQETIGEAMTVSGFITSIIAMFCLMAGLITSGHLFVSLMMMVLPAIWTYVSKSG